MLLACSVASVAAGFISQHHRQQTFIKMTAIAQLVAGISLFQLLIPCYYLVSHSTSLVRSFSNV